MKKCQIFFILGLILSCKIISAQYYQFFSNPEQTGEVSSVFAEYNNDLYLIYYLNPEFKYVLAKYNNGKITLIPNPDDGQGPSYNGGNIVYKNNLFFTYKNFSGNTVLAKYDGIKITLIPNPDNGAGIVGFYHFTDFTYNPFVIYKDVL